VYFADFLASKDLDSSGTLKILVTLGLSTGEPKEFLDIVFLGKRPNESDLSFLNRPLEDSGTILVESIRKQMIGIAVMLVEVGVDLNRSLLLSLQHSDMNKVTDAILNREDVDLSTFEDYEKITHFFQS
jgi:hypothetical protein